MSEPLVLSMSAIQSYKRCPKSYELSYEKLYDAATTKKDIVELGTSFHTYMASCATDGWLVEDKGDGMYTTARTYLAHHPLPYNIIGAEMAFYTKLLEEQNVWLRTTFDLVYRDGATIRGRDYKTFAKSPTLDLDLDFQGRIYIAALQRHYPNDDIEFEYEYVRQVPPGTKNSKGVWTPETCYLNFPLVISHAEADQLWQETQWVAEAILAARESKRFWRTDHKGWDGCGGCFMRDLCQSELTNGELTESELEVLAPNRREPATLPKED